MDSEQKMHVIWVCPNSDSFFRSKGEVQCRASSVIPKIIEKGVRLTVLIPFDSSLLPKTKLASSRITEHKVHLSQDHSIEIIKLTRAQVSPSIYMVKLPNLDPALKMGVFSKSALALANQIKRSVDVFHLFGWETSLVPLYLEMEGKENKIYKTTRTFLTINSIVDQGNFAPEVMAGLGIPKTLFHPDGLEFYGQFSFLKTGVLFSDGVGLVDVARRLNGKVHLGHRFNGVLDSQLYKLRQWSSERSVKSYLEAYQEIMVMLKAKPRLPVFVKNLHPTEAAAQKYMEVWGPVPPDRYHQNYLVLLAQSPRKAFTYWEWNDNTFTEFGIALEDTSSGHRRILSRGLSALGEFWFDVEPDKEYFVELLGWTSWGEMRVLLRSNRLRTAREVQSANKRAIFVDMRSKRRFQAKVTTSWEKIMRMVKGGGTSAEEWALRGDVQPGLIAMTPNVGSQFRKNIQ